MSSFSILPIRLRGFTLIELLVVISIVGILATLAFVSFTAAEKQTRDTQRKSDLKQLQTLIENYANSNNNIYPIDDAGHDVSNAVCPALGLSGSSCPEDPSYTDGSDHFYYNYNSNGTGRLYTLADKLESASTTTYFVVCSNGQAGSSTSYNGNTENCPADLK